MEKSIADLLNFFALFAIFYLLNGDLALDDAQVCNFPEIF